jgi:acetylornithine deacetylase/succinyl-diaminopimelate desuccinylase-like protein
VPLRLSGLILGKIMNILEEIKKRINCTDFQEEAMGFLTEICKIDTTPNVDVSVMGTREAEVFDLINNELAKMTSLNGKTEKFPVDPAIKNHSSFSQLHFTKTSECPEGLTAEEVYKERYNLLYLMDNESDSSGRNIAMNAHVDVVAPYFPPERKGDNLFGRGSIDDKGAVAVMISALKIINELQDKKLITLKNKITSMFVIEEETGGNGSLSLALDKKLKERYDSILVMECADNLIYPANRGAVWFKCELKTGASLLSANLLEAMVFAILATREEGRIIKEESEHPLFPHRPVQTCNGMLGSFGEHPSRICGHIVFQIKTKGVAQNAIEQCITAAINDYISIYGDKTQVIDSVTNQKKVDKHYELTAISDGFKIDVYGSTGHMGSILENDDAILKFANIAKHILKYKYSECPDLNLVLEGDDAKNALILEGGQGFLPTHNIEDVMKRISDAFKKGVDEYLKSIGSSDKINVDVSYNKLHNAAFDGDPESDSFKTAKFAAIQAGLINDDTVIKGWDVSCDARLFATEYPEMPVITSGPGGLKYAHADNENLPIPEFVKSVLFTTLFLLKETGTL